MSYGTLMMIVVQPHGSIFCFLSAYFFSSIRTTLVYVLCGLSSQNALPVTEAYYNTSVPWRWSNLARGTRSKAFFESKGSQTQDEYRSGDIKMTNLFRMITKTALKNELRDSKK